MLVCPGVITIIVSCCDSDKPPVVIKLIRIVLTEHLNIVKSYSDNKLVGYDQGNKNVCSKSCYRTGFFPVNPKYTVLSIPSKFQKPENDGKLVACDQGNQKNKK